MGAARIHDDACGLPEVQEPLLEPTPKGKVMPKAINDKTIDIGNWAFDKPTEVY